MKNKVMKWLFKTIVDGVEWGEESGVVFVLEELYKDTKIRPKSNGKFIGVDID